jgi:hypothetical protein
MTCRTCYSKHLNMWPLISGVAMVPYFCVAIVGIFKAQALVSNLFSGSRPDSSNGTETYAKPG